MKCGLKCHGCRGSSRMVLPAETAWMAAGVCVLREDMRKEVSFCVDCHTGFVVE
ncbi:hypothetical protein [Geobacter sp. FeAm09]|uniref:hypothetical protein n=1 Tax=Geobacter sp. FeAm09 TaxID=2597769 RepID=UPI00143D0540|nr:hypothetical protein [Geobacter sp. FeAm09]